MPFFLHFVALPNYQSLVRLVPGAVMQGEQNSPAGSTLFLTFADRYIKVNSKVKK